MKKTIYWCLGLCVGMIVLPPWVLWPLFDSMSGMTVLVASLLFVIPTFFVFSGCFLGKYGRKVVLVPVLEIILFFVSWSIRTGAWGDMLFYCAVYLPISYVAFAIAYWISWRERQIQEAKKSKLLDL